MKFLTYAYFINASTRLKRKLFAIDLARKKIIRQADKKTEARWEKNLNIQKVILDVINKSQK